MSEEGAYTGQKWSKANGDDVPPNVSVFRITDGVRKYRWYCRDCGMTQQCQSKASAFDLAWCHITGENPCEAQS